MIRMPITTISVRRKLDALSTICPSPAVAATISAATSVVQPNPIAIRRPVRISGSAAGSTTWRTICAKLPPSEYAALICSTVAARTPARAAIAIGAKHARKITTSFAVSSMPNQITTSGRYASGGSGR
ncbi:hypothetical protein WJ30_02290 [Burkholderia diffusa]|nr:hypothetical protein WJ30_02290 [Burkholderia diffusa]